MARDDDLSPDHRLSRLMTPALDPTTGAKEEPLRRLWPSAVAGTFLLAMLDAQGLEKWVARLPESPISNALIVGGREWKGWMDGLGPARTFAGVRKAFQKFRGR